MENVTLKERVDAKFTEIENMLVEAVLNGSAKVSEYTTGLADIDGVVLTESVTGKGAYMSHVFTHPALVKLVAPATSILQTKAENLRAQLKQVEEQLAERSAQ